MALKNSNENYLRIINIDIINKNIIIHIYKNESLKDSDDYLKLQISLANTLAKELTKVVDITKSIEDNFKTAGYLALKAGSHPYKEFDIDC